MEYYCERKYNLFFVIKMCGLKSKLILVGIPSNGCPKKTKRNVSDVPKTKTKKFPKLTNYNLESQSRRGRSTGLGASLKKKSKKESECPS